MNNLVIVGVLYIGGVAVVRSITTDKPVTPAIAGSFLLLLFLGGLEVVGGPAEQLADAFVGLTAIVVTLDYLPWDTLFTNVLKLQLGNGTTSNGFIKPGT